MRNICYTYTVHRFNFHSVKLATPSSHVYKSLVRIAIGRVEKLFTKCLNVVVLDTASTPIRISFAYA